MGLDSFEQSGWLRDSTDSSSLCGVLPGPLVEGLCPEASLISFNFDFDMVLFGFAFGVELVDLVTGYVRFLSSIARMRLTGAPSILWPWERL